MKWINAKQDPPEMKNNILALYSEYDIYAEYLRPHVLYVAKEPYPHFYNDSGEEIKMKHIFYYMNIPENPKK